MIRSSSGIILRSILIAAPYLIGRLIGRQLIYTSAHDGPGERLRNHCHDDGALRNISRLSGFPISERLGVSRPAIPSTLRPDMPSYPVVGEQLPALPLKDNPPGLEHVAVIGDLESGFGILLDQ